LNIHLISWLLLFFWILDVALIISVKVFNFLNERNLWIHFPSDGAIARTLRNTLSTFSKSCRRIKLDIRSALVFACTVSHYRFVYHSLLVRSRRFYHRFCPTTFVRMQLRLLLCLFSFNFKVPYKHWFDLFSEFFLPISI
jgi:hypothetical protein